MFMMSLFFQDPATLGMSPLEAGLATLPATVGLVVLTPARAEDGDRWGSRTVIVLGFVAHDRRLRGVPRHRQRRGRTPPSSSPSSLVAAGMALSNGPCSSIATSSVPEEQVGVGVRHLQHGPLRRRGGDDRDRRRRLHRRPAPIGIAAGDAADEALATAFARSSLVLAVISASGIGLAAARRPPPARCTEAGRRRRRGRVNVAHPSRRPGRRRRGPGRHRAEGPARRRTPSCRDGRTTLRR